jgi:hypothetical protein
VDVVASTDEGLVRVRLELSDEGPQPTQFEIRTPSQSTRQLRKLGYGWLVTDAQRALSDWAVGRFLGDAWQREVRRPGRAGRPDVFYAEWAERYVAALEVAPSRPIAHMVERAAARGEFWTDKQVRAYLNRARNRGLLTSPEPGRAGGEMTAEAVQMLKRRKVR